MEQNMPIVAKKFWNLVRVALFMLRKGISKSKLLADLNLMMKRGKIAGKAIQNLMFHHTHHWAAASSSSSASSISSRRSPDNPHHHPNLEEEFTPKPDEYEFSCSNSPAYPAFHLPFHLKKRKGGGKRGGQAKNKVEEDYDEFEAADKVVMKAIEILKSEAASPALPGFGKSPMVRQLRVTDSPFPVNYVGGDDEKHVDEAAEQFIKRFYKNLRSQNKIAWGSPAPR